MSGDEKSEAWNYIEEAVDEHEKARRESQDRNTSFDTPELDEDEMLKEVTEMICSIRFDRLGLSGIAKSI